jgi:KDO2-lipid IV(A) lauroyltransferase
MFRAFFSTMTDFPVMSMRRRIRARFEILAFHLAGHLIPVLSRWSIVALARFSGRLAWLVARRERRVALANLELAFGTTLSPDEKRDLVRKSFSTFVLTGLDYFWFSKDREQRMADWVIVHDANWPWMRQGATIAVTAHFGNWEILGWLTVQHGSRIASVAKPVKNPLIDAEINRMRTLSGQRIIPREGALRSLVRVLREGGTIALLLDQDTLPAEGGVFVPFFDVPVPVSTAAAGLALKLKVPILMAFCASNEKGVYHCHTRELLLPEDMEGMTPEDVTIRITRYLENQLREDPGHWLWTYKRWKRRLPGCDPSRYPYYADC